MFSSDIIKGDITTPLLHNGDKWGHNMVLSEIEGSSISVSTSSIAFGSILAENEDIGEKVLRKNKIRYYSIIRFSSLYLIILFNYLSNFFFFLLSLLNYNNLNI
ncbi:MAG: hypothetical protein Pg6B_09700 [Candidatus Azobacteroides pseudotrichonymphae]|nr:MAG: hypothetical protein Pg6B_09700 [Candidatus Azobacteroides pseudotrichonymphae]